MPGIVPCMLGVEGFCYLQPWRQEAFKGLPSDQAGTYVLGCTVMDSSGRHNLLWEVVSKGLHFPKAPLCADCLDVPSLCGFTAMGSGLRGPDTRQPHLQFWGSQAGYKLWPWPVFSHGSSYKQLWWGCSLLFQTKVSGALSHETGTFGHRDGYNCTNKKAYRHPAFKILS